MQVTPDGIDSLLRTGAAALQQGNAALARQKFEQATARSDAHAGAFLYLAQSCIGLGDNPAAHKALDQALERQPQSLHALIMKGDLLTSENKDRAAVSWYQQALSIASTVEGQIPIDLQQGLQRAANTVRATQENFRAQMQTALEGAGIAASEVGGRFAEAISILTGRSEPQLQQPTNFYYPRLPAIPFFDSTDFEWLDPMLERVPEMREEALAVLGDETAPEPYLRGDEDRFAREHDLLGDKRWSAFYLWRDGERMAANIERCPATVAALEHAPMPRIRARSPMALFSILRAGTHIRPHHGMINTRLICHIPLVVPPDCRLRVGNEVRNVEQGVPLIFDDTIEHEAWNDSDSSRLILLFEIWRPELSNEEIDALTALYEAITDYQPRGTA